MTDEQRYSEAELHAIFGRAAKRREEAYRAEAPATVAATARELIVEPPKVVPTFLGALPEAEKETGPVPRSRARP